MINLSIAQRLVLRFCLLLLGAVPMASNAKPYLPQSPDEVLERLPLFNNRTDQRLQGLQRQLTANPDNLIVAVATANRFIEIARSEADPRFYGYAEAAVKKWWQLPQPPLAVLMIRANLRQHRHDFVGALQDLHEVIAEEPRNAQAWLTQAVIQTVQGNYESAINSCSRLKRLASDLIASTCIGNAANLSGFVRQVYPKLKQIVDNAVTTDTETKLWSLTVLAEMANRLGDTKAAEEHFLQALALKQRDVYLLASYSDFLLEQQRAKQVIELLKADTRPDSLLLRLALAEQAEKSPLLAQHRQEIQQRMAAYRLRGENIHQREEARFYLKLLNQPSAALKAALLNWQVQREPADAQLVLESALAANQTAAAQAVLTWLKQTKLEDTQLQQDVTKLEQRR